MSNERQEVLISNKNAIEELLNDPRTGFPINKNTKTNKTWNKANISEWLKGIESKTGVKININVKEAATEKNVKGIHDYVKEQLREALPAIDEELKSFADEEAQRQQQKETDIKTAEQKAKQEQKANDNLSTLAKVAQIKHKTAADVIQQKQRETQERLATADPQIVEKVEDEKIEALNNKLKKMKTLKILSELGNDAFDMLPDNLKEEVITYKYERDKLKNLKGERPYRFKHPKQIQLPQSRTINPEIFIAGTGFLLNNTF